MPLKASNMSSNIAECEVQEGSDTVTVVFYPNKITNKIINQLDENVEGIDQSLCDVIKSWDVLEDDGSMTPLTPKRLAELSIPFKIKVARAVVRTVRPNSEAS